MLAQIGLFALDAAARELAAWQRALQVNPPIFASLNISSRQLLGNELLGAGTLLTLNMMVVMQLPGLAR